MKESLSSNLDKTINSTIITKNLELTNLNIFHLSKKLKDNISKG